MSLVPVPGSIFASPLQVAWVVLAEIRFGVYLTFGHLRPVLGHGGGRTKRLRDQGTKRPRDDKTTRLRDNRTTNHEKRATRSLTCPISAFTRAAAKTGGAAKKPSPMCSLQPWTCSQAQVLPRQWMVGPSSDSRPRLGQALLEQAQAGRSSSDRRIRP